MSNRSNNSNNSNNKSNSRSSNNNNNSMKSLREQQREQQQQQHSSSGRATRPELQQQQQQQQHQSSTSSGGNGGFGSGGGMMTGSSQQQQLQQHPLHQHHQQQQATLQMPLPNHPHHLSGGGVGGGVVGGGVGVSTSTGLPPDNMVNVGMDIQGLDLDRLAQKRIKKGECPTCGIQLFKVVRHGLRQKKTPLTVDKRVMNGRCLQCYPLPTQQHHQSAYYAHHQHQLGGVQPPVEAFRPYELTVPAPSDDSTLVSELTMDVDLASKAGALSSSGRTFALRPPLGAGVGDDELQQEAEQQDRDMLQPPVLPGKPGRPGPRQPSASEMHNAPLPPRTQRGGGDHNNPSDDEEGDSSNNNYGGRNNNGGELTTGGNLKQRALPEHDDDNEPDPRPPPRRRGAGVALSAGLLQEDASGSADTPKVTHHSAYNIINAASQQSNSPSSPRAASEIRLSGRSTDVDHMNDRTFQVPPWHQHNDHDHVVVAEAAVSAAVVAVNGGGGGGVMMTPQAAHPTQALRHREATPDEIPGPPKRQLSKRCVPHDDPEENGSAEQRKPAPSSFSSSSQQQQQQSTRSPRSMPNEDQRDGSNRRLDMKRPAMMTQQQHQHHHDDEPEETEEEDIVSLLSKLQLLQNNADERTKALDSITKAIYELGNSVKKKFVDYNGFEVLANTIWHDMVQNSNIVRSAFELMLALAASINEDPTGDVLVGDAAEAPMDALLITMQTLIRDEQLQPLGCRILCCLASASLTNENVIDGTRSGAVLTVLNAMDAHSESQTVQEWGVRALYNQCAYSSNAESNKRTLANSTLKSGAQGGDVLRKILKSFPEHHIVTEWTCKLYWRLTASEDVAEMLSPAGDVLQSFVRILTELSGRNNVLPTQEAVLGTINNLIKIEQNIDLLLDDDSTNIVIVVLDLMKQYEHNIDIIVESCFLIAGMAASSTLNRNTIIDGGLLRTLQNVMQERNFEGNEIICEAVLQALVTLTIGSEEIKEALRDPNVVQSIRRFTRSHEMSATCQELACGLLPSIFVSERAPSRGVNDFCIVPICSAMKNHADSEGVQDAACSALRNLSTLQQNRDILLSADVVRLVVEAMALFPRSKTIQSNACGTLWNLAISEDGKQGMEVDVKSIKCIVQSIQNHLETDSILELACGALWSLVQGSDELKQQILAIDGGVDTLTTVLLMHPNKPSLLENAVGALASLSANEMLAKAIADRSGIINAVDVMHNNPGSVTLLQFGAHFMRNVILLLPNHAKEAADAIPVVVHAMNEYENVASFQREACNFLWAISSLSMESKSKIIELDGAKALMNVLEHYSGVSQVEDAALGAFKEIAL